MSSPRSRQKQDSSDVRREEISAGDRKIETSRQPDLENYFNSLSDAEEHFEFSPDISDEATDPHAAHEAGVDESKLSSDSFRSTSSASSLSNCNNNNNPFPRNTHLRQSFSSRNTSWSPRSNFNRRSLNSHHNSHQHNASISSSLSKYTSANGHARQMFNSSNGNSPSSRRSSLSDEAISSNDPVSLEDDVLDLTQKIATLEQQVSALNQSQVSNDDRYSRVKQENASLLSKVHLLEEQLRDIEIQSEERRGEDDKRTRDLMARIEREKSIENEKCLNRIYSLQQDVCEAKEMARRHQITAEKTREEKTRLQDQIAGKEEEIERLEEELMRMREAVRRCRDEEIRQEHLCNVLQAEVNDLRQAAQSHQEMRLAGGCTISDHSLSHSELTELQLTLTNLRIDNQNLKEANEELQAQLLNSRLEEGRCLVRNGERVTTSLADELVTLNEEQSDDILQLRKGLREQQEVNAELRQYIDGVLMNIIENYPQLLEVKQVVPNTAQQ